MPLSPKLVGVLLSLSLAANAALVFQSVRRPAPAASPAPGFAAPGSNAGPVVTAPRPDNIPLPPDTWAKIHREDLPSYAANLRAAGLPERLIRTLVNAELNERFKAREDALKPKSAPANYWEADDYEQRNAADTLELRLARIDLRREKDALRLSLLGPEAPRANDTNPIPPAKRDALRKLNEDYDAMIQQAEAESRGFKLASDKEKIAFLRAEKDAELRSLLTPEEYSAHQLRNSNSARQLRWDLAGFKPSEEEFSLIYQLKEGDAELSKQPDNSYTQDDWKRRQDAEKQFRNTLRESLGAERYQDYVRGRDWNYRQLTQMATRLQLPVAAVNKIYDQRTTVPASALAIAQDPQRDRAAKQAALTALAQKARDEVYATLGQEAGEAYLKSNNGPNWLEHLDKGVIIVQTDDNGWQHRSLDEFTSRETPAATAK